MVRNPRTRAGESQGIPANVEWKKTLGQEWRQYEKTFPLLAASRIDQVSLECANSRVPLELLGLLRGKDVLVGCIDVATQAVETPEDVATVIRRAMHRSPAKAPRRQIWECLGGTNGGGRCSSHYRNASESSAAQRHRRRWRGSGRGVRVPPRLAGSDAGGSRPAKDMLERRWRRAIWRTGAA